MQKKLSEKRVPRELILDSAINNGYFSFYRQPETHQTMELHPVGEKLTLMAGVE